MNTHKGMDGKIVDLLRLSDDPKCHYAASRIEELEERLARTAWRPVSESPGKSGYVLLAGTHHRIPTVLYGFCRVYRDGTATFRDNIYQGQGVAITHWMPLPEHPDKKEVQHERA